MNRKKDVTVNNRFHHMARFGRVAIYCRVSSRIEAQTETIGPQQQTLLDFVNQRPDWRLHGIYTDVESGASVFKRKDFLRLMEDCRLDKYDYLVVRTVERFGRNTTESIQALRDIIGAGVQIIFVDSHLKEGLNDSELIFTLMSAVAEADNASRSENVRMGMEMRMQNGSSPLYYRPCYGYRNNEYGELNIDFEQARVVRQIFEWYLDGMSVLGIKAKLEEKGIRAPKGGSEWPKRTIDAILCNEKYAGNVTLMKTFTMPYPNRERKPNRGERKRYTIYGNHPAIVDSEMFEAVQKERENRSNVNEDGARKSTHYSSKNPKKG